MSELEKLLQENYAPLERFICFKIGNRHDAEDLLQEVCLAATKKFDSLKDKSVFKAWLIGIAKHKCNDYYRKKSAHPFVSLDILPETALVMGRAGITVQSVVRDTLELLPEKEKEILYLYFFLDLSQDEIARRLSVPLGTVKSRLHYAKENFRQHYPYKETPKGDHDMKTLPVYIPDYKIEKSDLAPFSVKWEETMGWFVVPKLGETIKWAMYDFPAKKRTELCEMEVVGKAEVHGIEGVEIVAIETDPMGCNSAGGQKRWSAALSHSSPTRIAAFSPKATWKTVSSITSLFWTARISWATGDLEKTTAATRFTSPQKATSRGTVTASPPKSRIFCWTSSGATT